MLLLALVAIGFEVTHPGAVWPGIVGVMAGVLALVALDTVPVSFGGLALFALAAVLFAIDLKAPSHGVLTTGGVISLIVGSLLVSDAASPFFVPNLALVAIPPLVAGALVAFVLSKTMAARRRPVQTGPDRLVGSLGQTRSEVGPGGGMVFVDGALWQARPVRAARIKPGSSVRVVAVEGIRLTVEPVG